MAIDVQAEALRRKTAGDPRPIPVIIAELSGAPEAAAPAPQAVTPTPGQPVPVGQTVDIQAPVPAPAPVVAAVPPMTTPFNPVAKAREAATPAPAKMADMSATDVAIKSAQQKGDPNADLDARVRGQYDADYKQMLQDRQHLRDTIGVPPELESLFKAREDRYAKQEAEIAADEKKQAWNALAMAGFQMAQSTSPYFMAALAAGMQSGLEGFNAAKAANAEKKARLADARENIALERYKSERGAESEQIADMDATAAAVDRKQQAILRGLQAAFESEMQPYKKAQIQAQIKSIESEMGSRALRDRLAVASFNREGAGSSGTLEKARGNAIDSAYEYGRKYAADKLEAAGMTLDDPGYSRAFEAASGEGADMWLNSNPRAKAVLGIGAKSIQAPARQAPAPAPKKKDSWWNPFD